METPTALLLNLFSTGPTDQLTNLHFCVNVVFVIGISIIVVVVIVVVIVVVVIWFMVRRREASIFFWSPLKVVSICSLVRPSVALYDKTRLF